MSEKITPSYTLDATGLQCPLPVLRAQKKLRDMANGEILQVLATDPGAPNDFIDFCKLTNMTLLETTKEQSHYSFMIRKS